MARCREIPGDTGRYREILAVEDDALLGERLAQVLGRLGLARARGALGRAAQVELHRTHERAVAAVGERRHDEPVRVAQVLEAVRALGGDHAHLGRVRGKG